ncbi:MAG: DoxX family protein [Prevotellaceae bacterium]|nr:DoxX family protein [Prevotella sp.]MDD7256809.1 DoxX family protein [Prevotellaceae bacterium]MDY6131139.1 DoxX family protein [Prevotella sp.]
MKLIHYLFPVKGYTKESSTFLLVSRFVFGLLLASHGWQKLMGFKTMSTQFPDPLGVGSDISLALAIFGELACSLSFVFGFLSRLVLIPMIFTMCVAFFTAHGGSIAEGELAFSYMVLFLLLLLAGPGRFSIDALIGKKLFSR